MEKETKEKLDFLDKQIPQLKGSRLWEVLIFLVYVFT